MAGNIVDKIDDWVRIDRVLESNPGVHFYSTGGTYRALAEILGVEAASHLTQVSDYTGQPETQGGLVKTLDFKIYLGLLTETYNEAHQGDLARTGAASLDMVVVNLYPFEATVARADVTVEEARANIDIGGPCMLRAAAKNYLRVASVVDPADYPGLADSLRSHSGQLNLARRFELARKAFAHTARYDTAIANFLTAQEPSRVPEAYTLAG
jgi:phosphoribosylaminoimidazolecarboxamide formyltransferase/IMP cyclohydrolase